MFYDRMFEIFKIVKFLNIFIVSEMNFCFITNTSLYFVYLNQDFKFVSFNVVCSVLKQTSHKILTNLFIFPH